MALWISCSNIATGHIPPCLQSVNRYLISLIKRGCVQSVLLRFIPQCSHCVNLYTQPWDGAVDKLFIHSCRPLLLPVTAHWLFFDQWLKTLSATQRTRPT